MVWGQGLDLDLLVERLAARGIQGRIPDLLEFARQSQILLLRHELGGTPLEIRLGSLPFESEALARSTVIDFGGVSVRTATAEDLIIYKAVSWRERDRADIERLLTLHRPYLDLGRIRGYVAQFAEALEEPERIGEFERLVGRALGKAR